MAKRIFLFILAAVVAFTVVGGAACDGTNQALADYKAVAILPLQDYATARGQSNFKTKNWARILYYVEGGTAAINETATKANVATARDKA